MRYPLLRYIPLLLLAAQAVPVHAAEQGVLRAISHTPDRLTIDEGRYRPSSQLHVYNLGAGLNELRYAVVGQPVRYTLNEHGEIDQLWLYPLRADERAALGIDLGDSTQ